MNKYINLRIGIEDASMIVRGLDRLFNYYFCTAYDNLLSKEDASNVNFASDLRAEITKKLTDVLIYGKEVSHD